MDMKQGKTLRAVSAVAFLLCATSACTSSSNLFSSIFGETRTLPDGDEVDFNNRHAPVLNPGSGNPMKQSPEAISGDQYYAGAARDVMPAQAQYASAPVMPYASSAPVVVPPGRHVPAENMMAETGAAPAVMSAPVSPISSAPIAAMPMQAAPMATMPVQPTAPAVTATPAASGSTAAVSSSGVPSPVLKDLSTGTDVAPASAPTVKDLSKEAPATAVPASATPAPVTPQPQASASPASYPVLANVPSTPEAPTNAQNTSQFNSLVAEHDNSESGRQQLMNDQSATVMTSPKTGQLVDNAATATAPSATLATATPVTPAAAPVAPAPAPAAQTANNTQSSGGFGSWLHHLFGGGAKPQAAAPAAATATASAPAQPATPAFQERDMSAEGAPAVPADTSAKSDTSVPSPQLVDLTVHPTTAESDAKPAVGATAQAAAAPTPSSATPDVTVETSPPPSTSPASDTAIQQALQNSNVGKEVAPNVVLVNPQVDIASQPIADTSAPATPSTAQAITAQPVADSNSATPTPAAQPVAAASEAAPAPAATSSDASVPAPVLTEAAVPAPAAPVAAPVAQAAAAAPSAPAETPASPAAVAAPAAMEPVHLIPPPVTADTAPEPAAAPAPATPALPDVSQISNTQEAPISLTPPSASGSAASQTKYLDDSRYAARRMQQDNGDSNSSN